MTVYHNFTWMYLNMSKLLVVIIDRIHKSFFKAMQYLTFFFLKNDAAANV